MTVRVHVGDVRHVFPDGTRFSTEEEFNNLCVWGGRQDAELLALFADGQWTLVEFCDV